MPRRLRKLLVLLSLAASAVTLSGCVAVNSTGSFQLESMGPVTLSVSGCSSGSPGCTGQANTGSIYGFLEGAPSEEVKIQVLLAVRLPEGSSPTSREAAYSPSRGARAMKPNCRRWSRRRQANAGGGGSPASTATRSRANSPSTCS